MQYHGEGCSLVDRNQLDVAHEVLAKGSHVVVHPQPLVLDIERETSANGPRLERDGETFIIKGSAYTSDLDRGE